MKAMAGDRIRHAGGHELIIAERKLPHDTNFRIKECIEKNEDTARVETNLLLLDITARDENRNDARLPRGTLTLRIHFAHLDPPLNEKELAIYRVQSSEPLKTVVKNGYAEAQLDRLSTYTLVAPS